VAFCFRQRVASVWARASPLASVPGSAANSKNRWQGTRGPLRFAIGKLAGKQQGWFHK